MDIQKILDDLDLIEQVIPDYPAGRRKGLTDDETEKAAGGAVAKAINALEELYNKLAEYEDAEEEGRLVELPCKVGDTVYFNSYYSKGTLRGEVKAITIDKHGTILTLLTKAKQITRKPIEQVYASEEEAEKTKGESLC